MRYLRLLLSAAFSSVCVSRFRNVQTGGILCLALLSACRPATALEACAVLPLVEASAALDPLASITVRGGTSTDPRISNCQYDSSTGQLLVVIVSENQPTCTSTLTKFGTEVPAPAPVAVSGVGEAALFRTQNGVSQLAAVNGARCLFLSVKGESQVAPLDARHSLAVLGAEAFQRSWSGPPKQPWDEPADQPRPLTQERIQQLEQLLKQRPKDRDLLIALGNLYIRSNDYEHAQPYFQQAVEIPPPRADLYYDLAETYWRPVKHFLAPSVPDGVPLPPLASRPCEKPDNSVIDNANRAIENMQKSFAADASYFPAASYLSSMYRGRAQLRCLDPAAQAEDLKRAGEWQQKATASVPLGGKMASPRPADTVAWQGTSPSGMPPAAIGGVLGGPIAPVPHLASAEPHRVQVAEGVSQGLLISQVKPVYPPLARQARIQGTVVLKAVISKDGSIDQLEVVSGHPMLIPAAMDAVKQWRYKPYYLNGESVEIATTINVNFLLQE